MSILKHALGPSIVLALAAACGGVPSDYATAVESTWAPARDLADRAAASCPAWKEKTFAPSPADAPTPPSVAIGAPFDADPRVVQVTVDCSWPEEKHGEISRGTQVGKMNSVRGGPHVSRVVWSQLEGRRREELRVPSAFPGADADLVAIRTTDEGLVEVHVALRR